MMNSDRSMYVYFTTIANEFKINLQYVVFPNGLVSSLNHKIMVGYGMVFVRIQVYSVLIVIVVNSSLKLTVLLSLFTYT